MPHSERSTRTGDGWHVCPYCGVRLPNPKAVTCRAHADLPPLEPLDDRYALVEDA